MAKSTGEYVAIKGTMSEATYNLVADCLELARCELLKDIPNLDDEHRSPVINFLATITHAESRLENISTQYEWHVKPTTVKPSASKASGRGSAKKKAPSA
jgi:hypothetical protein